MRADGSTLSDRAFGNSADADLVVSYQSHQDAMRAISATLRRSCGVALLIGPSGSGRTTLLKQQHARLARKGSVALVEGEQLTLRALAKGVLGEFGIEARRHDDDQQLLQRLSAFVTEHTRNGTSPVLIIDNADKTPPSVLRLLNWLAGLESRDRFALRILLAGQYRLSQIVDDHGMQNLSRRHPSVYSLNPLTEQEAMTYLRTRWIAAGGDNSQEVFAIDVCAGLQELSKGWPGLLNKHAAELVDCMAADEPSAPGPRLHVTRDGQTLASYDLTRREYVIGRSELSDILIEDTYVSKIHAMIKVYGNATILVDLNSTNGTSVNSRIVQKAVLRSDDVITLGHYKLKVENIPVLSPDLEEEVRASDTMRMQNLVDLRRARARRTIKVLRHQSDYSGL